MKAKSKKCKDWHPADVKAALAKKGYSFARIAREYGYGERSPNTVLWRSWAPMERIVADIIGTHPKSIWPSRYDSKGNNMKTRTRLARVKAVGNV